MSDSFTNYAVFRKSSIPEWILVDEDWKEFTSFFKENINDSNVLTDDELIELHLLERNNAKINDNLKFRMDHIAKKYPIWSATEQTVMEMKKTIDVHRQQKELLDELTTKITVSNLKAIEQLTAWRGKKSKLLLNEQTVTDECMKQMNELKEVKLSNERKVIELGQLYSKSAQNPLFIHQMNLNNFFRQLEHFSDSAKHFIRKNFNVQNISMPDDFEKQNDKKQVLNDLKTATDRLKNVYDKLYLSEMNLNAKTMLMNQFKMQNWSPSTLAAMRRDLLQMQRKIEMNEEQKQHLLYNIQEQAIEMSQLDTDALVYESNKKRMQRAKHRMDYLMRYANHISGTMLISEILWVLLQFDMERMKSRSAYDNKLNTYRIDSLCNRRIEVLNVIRKHSYDSHINVYCNQLFGESLHDIGGAMKCGSSVNELKSDVYKLFQHPKEQTHFSFDDIEFLYNISKKEEFIRKLLYDGPNTKLQYVCEWYRKKKAALEIELQQTNTKNEEKKEECGHYIKKWSNDKYWRYLQVFWVWFLTEPKKVIKSLELIRNEVQQRIKNGPIAARHITGIIRKK